MGNNFLANKKHLMLKVPSSIVPAEYNYLLNPMHPDMKKVKIIMKEPFDFDSRLV
jgi:RES domain-containing protein